MECCSASIESQRLIARSAGDSGPGIAAAAFRRCTWALASSEERVGCLRKLSRDS